ncbi:MAG: efflux RND transporter periplasmic adaptor subunit [candidate division Zixibacteria bacterium]|nr:efflux RND transporter periplasmic adaptor subunit [candidate division Zixibacteria bacterium]NIR64520.1 efflux RND transporter periplasmic adaptor subunit [candidate division Zixibacteria bacterium]NIS16589.1 efflux RND transporter periplasmic adaptor subunit [candidate division Zixibacteria bacterium]NIS46297.1 efflux RND transporter periplasmic adaptor subunit [candidate division Zixibacteria bacterium]NIT52951.1 efflux RND transporter periplasmic adaptor subunit [candidate division Zixib
MSRETTRSRIKDYRMDEKENNQTNNPETADLSALRINRLKEERIKRRRWPKFIPWILVVAAMVIGYFIVLDRIKQGKPVDTTTVRLVKGASAQATLSASGYVVAQRQSAVASKGTGRLEYMAVEEGDRVEKGEVIARIENDDVRASLDLARANLSYAIADSAEAAARHELNRKLYEAGSRTEEELLTYKARMEMAAATVEARRAQVRSAEINLENTFVTAPFTGKVITKIAEIGDIVAPMASSASSRGAVVVLADMSSLEVEADVSESNIQKVNVGQPCEIVLDAYPEVRYRGSVKNIVPTADRASATIMTRIAFNQLDSLIYPEMSARIYFMSPDEEPLEVEEPSFVGVSQNAIMEEDGEQYVFLVKGDIVEKKAIKTGKTVGRTVEILEGLEEGDEVVLTPPSSLQEGDKIEVGD